MAPTVATPLTRRLDIDHPILLAPMDLVSDAQLTAAVSAAGGLGILGGGYGDETWLVRELDALAALGGRFGVGFITWSMARRPGVLELVLRRRPAALMLSFGDPMPFAPRIREAGVPLICQVQNLAYARRALDAGADVLVAQGGEAGGHGTGMRSTFTLVPEVADLVARTRPEVLVLAAGGVADGRGLAAALTLGADGVLVGTRLWATPEADVNPLAQQRAVHADSDDTIRTSVYDIVRAAPWPAQYNGRLLRNEFIDRWHGRETELLSGVPEAAAAYREAVEQGDFGVANMIVGESVGLVRDVLPARAVVEQMVEQAEAVLARHATRTVAAR
jgi:nitronate monooxygenase